MKKLPKRIILILALILAMYVALNIGFMVFGKAVIIIQIEKNLKAKTTIQSVSFGFPLSININGLDINGLVKADSVSVSPSIIGFLAGKIILNELKIVTPEITLVRSEEGKLNLPQLEAKGRQPPLFLAGLKINNGRFIFIDKRITPEGHQVIVDNINVTIAKDAFPPTSLYTRFNVSASLSDNNNQSSGSALASGWIDFRQKDMDGKIELKDINGVSLAAYYQNLIPNKKLLSAKLNFTADLKAKNNDLTAQCHLVFSNLIFEKQAEPKKEQPASDIVPNILNLFADASGNIALDFTINTKLDKPKIDLVSLKGSIGQAAVQNIVHQPPEQVIEKVKSAVEEFKELGESLKDIFEKKEK